MSDLQKPVIANIRPQEDGRIFSQELIDLGCHVCDCPIFELKILGETLPEILTPKISTFEAIIFTSANGVRAFCALHQDRDFKIPVFCVGPQTTDLALQIFTNAVVVNACGNARDLTQAIGLHFDTVPDKPLLYIRAEHISADLEADLSHAGFRVHAHVSYSMQAIEALSESFVVQIKKREIDAIPFFSVRAAEHFLELAEKQALFDSLDSIKALSISERVLECVRTDLWESTHVAKSPDRQGMLQIIQDVCLP